VCVAVTKFRTKYFLIELCLEREVGNGEGISTSLADYNGLRERREFPSVVQARASATNAFVAYLKYTEHFS